MSKDLHNDEDRQLALSPSEFELLSRLHNVCVWLALDDHDKVVERIMAEFEVTEPGAKLWIQKAQDFMATGIIDGVDKAREMYHLRLMRMHDICISNS